MTVASLVVDLRADAASFHDEMDKAARHIEMLGRHIARAGTEITKLFSPIAVLYAAALTAAVKQSALVHGQLAQEWDRLTLSARLLFREIGAALTPAFERMIASKEQLIQKARQLVEWFKELSPKTQDLIIKVALFLAVLGPTVLIIGQVVRAAGALYFVFSQLAGLIAAAVGPALAFLVSPAGLITLAILGIAAAVFLLIRHWQLAKQVAAIEWQEIKALVLDAALGILTALTMIPAGTPIFGGLGEAASAAIPKIIALRDTVQHAASDMIQSLKMDKPLLPDWMMHPIDTLKNLFNFKLPPIPPLPTAPVLEAADTLTTLQTNLNAARESSIAFGNSFDLAGAQASAYKSAIDELIGKGIQLDTVLDKNGTTIRKLGKDWQNATLNAKETAALTSAIAQGFTRLASTIGQVLGGSIKTLKQFGGALLGVIGNVMETLGAALISVGAAKMAALSLNPAAAIEVGAALVAFGAALSAASQAIANPSSAGGGGGAAAPASGSSLPSGQSGQGSGTIVLEFHGGRADFSDPRDQDALAQGIQSLTGRNVKIVFAPS